MKQRSDEILLILFSLTYTHLTREEAYTAEAAKDLAMGGITEALTMFQETDPELRKYLSDLITAMVDNAGSTRS